MSIHHWQTLFDVCHLEMNVLTHKTFDRYLKILAYIKSGLIFEDHATDNFKLIFRWLVILSAHFIVESDKQNNATWKTHNINNNVNRYLCRSLHFIIIEWNLEYNWKQMFCLQASDELIASFVEYFHKPEAIHLFCYQKRSYSESIRGLFNIVYLCPSCIMCQRQSVSF